MDLYLAAASIAAGRLPDVVEYWTGMPARAILRRDHCRMSKRLESCR
jgi:hypothetical protein